MLLKHRATEGSVLTHLWAQVAGPSPGARSRPPGLVVEPSAALGIAAVIEDRNRSASRHVVTIVCGSNVDIDAYHRWVGAAP